MYNIPPPYNYCQQSPCYSDGDDRIYKRRRNEISGRQRIAANERERKRMNRWYTCRRRHGIHPKTYRPSTRQKYQPDGPKTEHKILINSVGEDSSLYMVSWRRTPQKYGEIHETPRGQVVYRKSVLGCLGLNEEKDIWRI
ncbi:hypothetical protein COOONC_22114 [Cooperia oncophora]